MAEGHQHELASSPAVPQETERRIVGWAVAQHRGGTVVRRELIQWFAESLLKHTEHDDRSADNATITLAYIDSLIGRFPELSRTLEVPPHPTPKPSSSEAAQNQGKPLRGSDMLKVMMEKERMRALYGDSPPPQRQAASYPEGHILYKSNTRYVVQHGDTITKYSTSEEGLGHFDRPNEAAVLEFVREHTSIPVPKLVSSDWDRITMEYIEGRTLQQAWPVLSQDERTDILSELRGYISQLRQLPGKSLCRLDGQGVILQSMMTRTGGPFDTVSELHDWLVKPRYYTEGQSMYWHQITAQLGNDFPIVFTHGDIAARNILVNNGHIVALIDWECAGWYPEYWEYVFAMRGLDNVDWETLGSHLPSLFDKRFDLEYILMNFILRIS